MRKGTVQPTPKGRRRKARRNGLEGEFLYEGRVAERKKMRGRRRKKIDET